jgi:hypothetical protein
MHHLMMVARHDAYIDPYFKNSQLLFYVNLCKSGERSE